MRMAKKPSLLQSIWRSSFILLSKGEVIDEKNNYYDEPFNKIPLKYYEHA